MVKAAVPDDMDDEIAAQIFITTLTVVGMVETAAVPQVSKIKPIRCGQTA